MKVLMVNKFYHIKGGSETYLFGLKELLDKNGDCVITFSMKDSKNMQNEYEEYFIENIDYTEKNIAKKIQNAVKIIYNNEAAKKIDKLIEKTNPDIVHLHLFQHQISPSILKVIKKKKIPIVYTVHDLKPVCLNYKMMNSKGICEECKGKKYYRCLKNKCVKDSYIFSAINMVEGYFHEFMKSYDLIDKFLTPSEFYRKKLIEDGYLSEKVIHVPNFIDIDKFEPNYNFEDYFLYVGRLSEEKGIETLVKSMKKVKISKLKIVGTGPIEDKLKMMVKKDNISNVEFLGFKSGENLKEVISKSKFIVIPSEWYENGPMSVLESMALGKAIIGADIGGIPELVRENINGYLFESGNVKELTDVIIRLLEDEEKIIQFGQMSRKIMEKKYNSKTHYETISSIYKQVIERNNLQLV